MSECPEELVCFTEQEWVDFLIEYELDIVDEVGGLPVAPTSDKINGSSNGSIAENDASIIHVGGISNGAAFTAINRKNIPR